MLQLRRAQVGRGEHNYNPIRDGSANGPTYIMIASVSRALYIIGARSFVKKVNYNCNNRNMQTIDDQDHGFEIGCLLVL